VLLLLLLLLLCRLAAGLRPLLPAWRPFVARSRRRSALLRLHACAARPLALRMARHQVRRTHYVACWAAARRRKGLRPRRAGAGRCRQRGTLPWPRLKQLAAGGGRRRCLLWLLRSGGSQLSQQAVGRRRRRRRGAAELAGRRDRAAAAAAAAAAANDSHEPRSAAGVPGPLASIPRWLLLRLLRLLLLHLLRSPRICRRRSRHGGKQLGHANRVNRRWHLLQQGAAAAAARQGRRGGAVARAWRRGRGRKRPRPGRAWHGGLPAAIHQPLQEREGAAARRTLCES
jgi:hypothetical protein